MGTPELVILGFFAIVFVAIPAFFLYTIIKLAVRAALRSSRRD